MPAAAHEPQRLRELFAKRAMLSQRAFGERYHIGSGSMVWQYLNGRRALGLRAGCQFAAGLGVDLAEFSPRLARELEEVLDATIGSRGQAESIQGNYVRIPCVEIVVKLGVKGYSIKPLLPAASFIAFRRDWLLVRGYSENNLLAIECADDAMRPTIAKGDIVVVDDASTAPIDSAVYAVNYEGQVQIRRVFRDAGYWWLHCDNPDPQRYPRKQLVMKHCFLLGRVVHRQSELI